LVHEFLLDGIAFAGLWKALKQGCNTIHLVPNILLDGKNITGWLLLPATKHGKENLTSMVRKYS